MTDAGTPCPVALTERLSFLRTGCRNVSGNPCAGLFRTFQNMY